MTPSPPNARVLLWDFDGTLADTLRHALVIYNRLAEKHGYRVIDEPEAVRGMTMREFLKSHDVPAYRVPFLFTRILTAMKSAAEVPRLFPGTAETVRQLSVAGYRHGIVSSNATETIERCLQHHQLQEHFMSICGTSRLFGKERRLRKAVQQFDVNQRDCLYLGDEVRDIEAARACGMSVASVTWGLNSRDVLEQHGPAFLVESIAELPNQLETWFGQDSDGI